MPNGSNVNRMERFTQGARQVLMYAHEEAERLQHSTIDTEHLLIGLIREAEGTAHRVLTELGLDQARITQLVEQMVPAGQHEPPIRLDLSPDMKQVLELAVDEARSMGHHYIDTEHLLLGLSRHSTGVGMEVLKRLNIAPEEIRRRCTGK